MTGEKQGFFGVLGVGIWVCGLGCWGGAGCGVLGGGLAGWVWLVLVSSRAGVWASVPRAGSEALPEPGEPSIRFIFALCKLEI